MGKSIKLSKQDLILKDPEFWVSFGDHGSGRPQRMRSGARPFELLVCYMDDAEYQRKIQKKAEIKEKGISRKLTQTTSLTQLAELQAKLLVKDWKMPADRFYLSVTVTPEAVAAATKGQGFALDDVIDFDPEICAEFLKSNWGYTNFVQESCHKAYLANAKAEGKATGNLSGASEND